MAVMALTGRPLSAVATSLQLAENAAVATGLDVVEPFAMVTNPAVRPRLHAF